MKMRDLEARTGVNRETIRVFLRHGLIPEPSRPKSNVADYDDTHVRAIASVRDLQRHSAMTLRQIQDALDGEKPQQRIEASAFDNLETLASMRVASDVQPRLIASLAAAFPTAAENAEQLASIGVIEILKSPGGPALSITDARLVTIWCEMQREGFSQSNGFLPEIVTFYIEAAEREATLFRERTDGRVSDDEAARMLQVGLRLMLDFFGLIRVKRFVAHIHRAAATDAKLQPTSRSRTRARAASTPRGAT